MRHEVQSGEKGWVLYEWQGAGRWNRLFATRGGPPARPAPDSIEAFIENRPWGYARQRDRSTVEYQVDHPEWDVWPIDEARLECDVAGGAIVR